MKGIVKKLCDIDGIAIDEADAAAQADQMQLFMNVGSVSGIFGNMKKIGDRVGTHRGRSRPRRQ